jgi:FixJ family two-component response regulator
MRASPLVHIVDDDAAVRDALTMLIEQHGLAALPFDGAAAFFAAVEPAAMGCALVDVRMPEMDGMAMHAEMLRRGYAMPVLMLSGHGDIPMSVRAMKAGAINFLSKPVAAAVLVEALREAIGIDLQAHGPVATPAGSDDVRLDVLTPRERDVIRLALRGMANKEVARSLGISHRTVEIHKARAMQKLGVRSLLELRYLPGADGAG